MVSIKADVTGMRGSSLRGMPTFRSADRAGETREGMVRSTGGQSGKKVSGKLSSLRTGEKWSRNPKCRVLRKSNQRRDAIIRGLNQRQDGYYSNYTVADILY